MALWGGVTVDDGIYDTIVAAACRHNQPSGLALWLARFESTFNPRAVSYYKSCCKGLYQFNNVTGGLGMGIDDETLFNPEFNAEKAMAYMEANGGIEKVTANVNPWEAGPIALAAWNADLRYNPPCPGASGSGTGTGDGSGSDGGGGGSAPDVGSGSGGGGAVYPPYGGGDPGSGSGPAQSFPMALPDILTRLPALLKLGAANAAVLFVAAVFALLGVYLVVTAAGGVTEGDLAKTALKVAA